MPLGLEGIEMPCPVQNDNVDHLRSQLEMEKKHGR